MSTSIIYHGFGIRGYSQRRFEAKGGRLTFWLRALQSRLLCAACSSRKVISRGTVTRRFRTVPIGRKPVDIVLDVPRLECRVCGAVRQIKLGFADPYQTYTRSLERLALELSEHMTIKAVASYLRLNWHTVKSIQKRALSKRFGRPRLRHVRRIGIDEIYIGKRRGFITLVLDLDTGAILYVGEGKSKASLHGFWRRLRHSRAKIEAVAIDMSKAYISAVRENLPDAVLVFDHFHVVKLFNEKLSELRRSMQREAEDKMAKKIFKGSRWLLLKNPENLCEARGEKARLKEILRMNEPLSIAYYLKEDLRQIWAQPDQATARTVFDDWLARAEASGVKILKAVAKTFLEYRDGILAYYQARITTAKVEGTNNKIRALQRQAYGYRDDEFFDLKLKSLHAAHTTIVGLIGAN